MNYDVYAIESNGNSRFVGSVDTYEAASEKALEITRAGKIGLFTDAGNHCPLVTNPERL